MVTAGFVQKFGSKEAVNIREASGQSVRDFTIKTVTQKLVRITLWPELASVVVGAGDFVAVEAASSRSGDASQYPNISASQCAVLSGAVRAERQVVNKTAAPVVSSTTTTTDDAPF